MDVKLVAIFLAIVLKAVLDYVAEPIRSHWPNVDLWWFKYVSLVLGAVLCWFIPLNVFAPYFDNVIVGNLLTGMLVGGVPKLLNDVLSNAPHASPAETIQTTATRLAMGSVGLSLPPMTKYRVVHPRGW